MALHLIDGHFFKNIIGLISRPGQFIREYLKGNSHHQNPASYYFTSLAFLFFLSRVYDLIGISEVVEPSGNSTLDNYAQYLVTLPFVLTISVFNYLFFKESKLNYFSHLIIAFFIIGQCLVYLTVYFFFTEVLLWLDEPMTQALIYSLIILINIVLINYKTFQQSLMKSFWKSLTILMIAFFVMAVFFAVI